MLNSNKETIFLLLLVELVIIIAVIFLIFTFTGGWYQLILFDAVECKDWYKISDLLGEKYDSQIDEKFKGIVLTFNEKVERWSEYCN